MFLKTKDPKGKDILVQIVKSLDFGSGKNQFVDPRHQSTEY
jgi:hypothetical protein